MKRRLIVFGGTTEARELLERGVPQTEIFPGPSVLCCTATDYGAELVKGLKNVEARAGRLDEPEMEDFFRLEGATHVIDATHPYARDVTKNIRLACGNAGVKYLRVARAKTSLSGNVTVAASPEEAAALLNESDEKVLLAVGSKALPVFAGVKNARARLFVRVLPTSDVLARCESLGFDAGHIIAMQGSFSAEMNEQMLAMTGAETIVTKDGGAAGGTAEKFRAAQNRNARVILIGRPCEDEGVSPEEALLWMRREMGFCAPPLFPMLLPVEGATALVAGGGGVALRRAKTLEKCGARVRVVSPKFCDGWDADAEKILRPWRPADLDGVFLAVAATDSREENSKIAAEAKKRNVPVSVADRAAEGTFYFPALVESRGAAVSVSTGGVSPALTHRLANVMRELWPGIVADARDAESGEEKEDGTR